MDSLLRIQRDIMAKATNARSNFKKSPKDRLASPDYIEGRIRILDDMWSEFKGTHKSLISDVKTEQFESSVYHKEQHYESMEEYYLSYRAELKQALGLIKKEVIIREPNLGQASCEASKKICQVKLPKISIPTFSGRYTEWPTFKDLFVSLIDRNEGLDKVQKLQYLKSHLAGEAEQLVRNIPITESNYEVCWNALKNRFDNKKYLANSIMRRLMAQRNLTAESAAGLKGLVDTTSDCLSALKNLGVPVETWDLIIIHIVSQKLDGESRKQWELEFACTVSEELPSFSEFKNFLENRFRAFEAIEYKKTASVSSMPGQSGISRSFHASIAACAFCKEDHKLASCGEFSKETPESRCEFVQNNKLCFNCLGMYHQAKACRMGMACRICRRKHHTLLHVKGASDTQGVVECHHASGIVPSDNGESPDTQEDVQVSSHVSSGSCPGRVLLATALVRAQSERGQKQLIRALLDQGSQASFITESAVQLLGLKKQAVRGVVSGIGGGQSKLVANSMVVVDIESAMNPNATIQVRAYVLSSITTLLPVEKLDKINWLELEHLELADPGYHTPSKIDILLGAEIYSHVLEQGLIKGPCDTPVVAQKTMLGWILTGQVGRGHVTSEEACCHNIVSMHVKNDENEIIRRFWEMEEPHSENTFLTQEELRCEEIFATTTRRDDEGRYIVELPFRDPNEAKNFPDSRNIAIRRFKSLERRLSKDKVLKDEYIKVIHEYLELGHMEKVHKRDVRAEAGYLPHHAVVRQDKVTTKVRVVFDASCKDASGLSLNDRLMVGPKLQPELRHTIMRFRMHPICLCADVEKMYRQVKMTEASGDCHRIIWRDDPNKELEDYRLMRVTFGVASSAYLAVRAMQQLSYDDGKKYPLAAERVLMDFYVDDLMTGCQTVEEGYEIFKQINELMSRGGLSLQKWVTNNEQLLSMMGQGSSERAEESDNGNSKDLNVKTDNVLKILGLTWNRVDDYFEYAVRLPEIQHPMTKRSVIADIARLYDPLGWVAPCIVKAKIFIQNIWLAGVGWDEELPEELRKEWILYRSELGGLAEFKLNRFVGKFNSDKIFELHGFCDASVSAFAGVIYLRIIDAKGGVRVNLLTAKTKVAPVKQVSVPRLELCGAVLLANLLKEVSEVLKIPISSTHAWTDSTVVLAWLSCHPSRWQTFVANRVSAVLSVMESNQWCHVKSEDNPADCASRGLKANELKNNILWINGPKWLQKEKIIYEKPRAIMTKLEERVIKSHVIANEDSEVDSVWEKYSSLTKLVRVIAYCKRFLRKDKQNLPDYLTAAELRESLKSCVKQCQSIEFKEEIDDIRCAGSVKPKSKIASLNPFLDESGVLRVGGRLEKSKMKADMKHPLLIPQKSHLTGLIVADAHAKTLHGGPQLMMNYLRASYWIMGMKNAVKLHYRKCVTCIRYAGISKAQLMGQLPGCRSTVGKPFLRSGVDYAGPISLKVSKGRGVRSYKGYICLFVCMATRAVHLEAVSDLSTKGFLDAFKRFTARRGHCSDIWSDNGTNFVGAARELKELSKAENSNLLVDIAKCLPENGTSWHFIPPHAPNFGGLWESGIKSTKYHLKRVIGETRLTYEEMSTLLSQIEACLNSRPLSRMAQGEGEPLTPGHFLVGGPLVTAPDVDYTDVANVGSLRRWQLTQRMLQDFWKRWSREYLTQFLQRYRWAQLGVEPNVGDVVLVKEDNMPPAKWLMGKIIEKHAGADNLTRVVTLKCKGINIKRPVSKLVLLPVAE